jgi:putative hydrolase of the HAD superfamily
MGYKLGVISNTDSLDFVTRRLYNNNIFQYFEPGCIYLSSLSQYRKPGKDIFLEACKDLGCKPADVVYVGDTISRDVEGSRNAKLKACIRIESNNIDKSSAEEKKPDTKFVISKFQNILEILKQIDKVSSTASINLNTMKKNKNKK